MLEAEVRRGSFFSLFLMRFSNEQHRVVSELDRWCKSTKVGEYREDKRMRCKVW